MSYTYDVSVILVNYNGKRYIDTLFESLKALEHPNFSYEVVFVDNASTDDSVVYLENMRSELPFDLNIIKNKKNRGFAGGNNTGVRAAKGEYIVLLNNDTKVRKDWLSELYHFIKNHKNVAMVNSKLLFFYDFIRLQGKTEDIVWIDDELTINGTKYKLDPKFVKNGKYEQGLLGITNDTEIFIPLYEGNKTYNLELDVLSSLRGKNYIQHNDNLIELNHGKVQYTIPQEIVAAETVQLIQNAGSGVNEAYDGYDIGFCELDSEKYSEPYEINNGCGAAIIMKKADFVDVGMFDERFFMYYEDTDLSYRIKKKGKIMYCPTAVVRHIHTGSSKEWSPFFTYHVFRNKLLFVYKNISKVAYLRYFKALYKQGKNEQNLYKLCGCKDSLKIILGMKKKTSYRW